MDLILLQDVEKIGKEGTVVRVKPGFARNYLLPRRLAVPATPEHQRAFEERKRQTARKQARLHQRAAGLKQKLESRSLTLKLNLGEGEKAFGSVTVHDIVEALAQEGVTLEKHAVQLPDPIKVLGIYEVPVRLHPEVTATLKLWVVKA
jgi:large subunit ribosomal protein L9